MPGDDDIGVECPAGQCNRRRSVPGGEATNDQLKVDQPQLLESPPASELSVRLRGRASLREARVIIEDWRADYNANRPHTAHREHTSTESALQWTATTGPPQGGDYSGCVWPHCRRGDGGTPT